MTAAHFISNQKIWKIVSLVMIYFYKQIQITDKIIDFMIFMIIIIHKYAGYNIYSQYLIIV